MTRNLVRRIAPTLKGVVAAAALVACLASGVARAQFEVVIGPGAEYRATNEPVYYEGHAAYWYQNRWYYREGTNWRYYHDEPQYLHDYRGHREPRRQFYGRGRGWGREGFHRR